jgi:hypothetical protein
VRLLHLNDSGAQPVQLLVPSSHQLVLLPHQLQCGVALPPHLGLQQLLRFFAAGDLFSEETDLRPPFLLEVTGLQASSEANRFIT